MMADYYVRNNESQGIINYEIADESITNRVNVYSFYTPLCKSGYLTPLQRKKMREKRKLDISSEFSENVNKVANENKRPKKLQSLKKVRNLKKSNKRDRKTKELNQQKILKEGFPHVKYVASHLIRRKLDESSKTKKFFKCRSPTHLEKANFTMPLIYRKRLCFDFDVKNKDLDLNIAFKTRQKFSTTDGFLNSSIEDSSNDTSGVKISSENNVSKLFTNVSIEKELADISSPHRPLSSMENIVETPKLYNKLDRMQSMFSNFSRSKEQPEKSLFDFEWPSDEVLLERQQKARAAVRRQLIEKKLNCSTEFSVHRKEVENLSIQKLYPVFNGTNIVRKDQEFKRLSPKHVSKLRTNSSKDSDQLIIDAGQKKIGAVVCETCSMVFTIGDGKDEELHTKYHNVYLTNLKFPGWKKEHVIGEYCDGRIIMVRKEDKNFVLNKVKDVLEIANRDLGFPNAGFPTKPDVIFLLFISSDKRVAGCLVAERISSACKVVLMENAGTATEQVLEMPEKVWKIGNWYSSSEILPAICGINRIWVSSNYRRRKVAFRMVDCLRCCFIYGHVVGIRELAFTDPTPDGREFAAAYTGTDNFLIYK